MRIGRLKIDCGTVKNSLAKRVLWVFFLCTLLPLCALALFSLFHVSRELERQADQKLHRACKSAG